KGPLDTLLRQVNDPPPLYGAAGARLPTTLIPVLRKALAKDSKDRYPSARDLIEALRAARRLAYRDAPPPSAESEALDRDAPPEPPVLKKTVVVRRPPLPSRATSAAPALTTPPSPLAPPILARPTPPPLPTFTELPAVPPPPPGAIPPVVAPPSTTRRSHGWAIGAALLIALVAVALALGRRPVPPSPP